MKKYIPSVRDVHGLKRAPVLAESDLSGVWIPPMEVYIAKDAERVVRNLLREYCSATKLEPWSGDWQCEQVVRDAVQMLGLKYGESL